MKTLYITDLDGTLLDRNQHVPQESIAILNGLIEKGMLFSYATARSIVSASKVTEGIHIDIPVVTGNGVSIVEPRTREILSTMKFPKEDLEQLIQYIRKYHIYPLVMSYIDGVEKCSWVRGKENEGLIHYLNQPVRKEDKRMHPVDTFEELFQGDVFYVDCMGTEQDFVEIERELKAESRYRCFGGKQLYDEDYWLEIMPKEATKSNAILKLKEMLGCHRIICFGDGINDVSMFEIADECYAVENAEAGLKAIATGVIGDNESGGVAKWLQEIKSPGRKPGQID